MELIKRYQQEIEQNGYVADPTQLSAISRLSELSNELAKFENNRSHWLAKFRTVPTPKGVYFWGGVGRGKTFIMDLFFDETPVAKKKRIHFHRFMRLVHNLLAENESIKNPINKIIEDYSKETVLLCLDEFFVADIADAMILSNLLDACYKFGVVVVTTSNIFPDGLYENGLQRARFLPAIESIKKRFDVIELDGGSDYRLNTLRSSPLYFTPLNSMAYSEMEKMFLQLVPDIAEVESGLGIEILGRAINCIQVCEDVLWATFDDLCVGPRSVSDYIELSKLYHAVLISNIPVMGVSLDDAARRFVHMIDEFYDRGVKVIISSESEVYGLYTGTRLSFEFERTISRLLEMQSEEYLARAHKPI